MSSSGTPPPSPEAAIVQFLGTVAFARTATFIMNVFGFKSVNVEGLPVLKDASIAKPAATNVPDEFTIEVSNFPRNVGLGEGFAGAMDEHQSIAFSTNDAGIHSFKTPTFGFKFFNHGDAHIRWNSATGKGVYSLWHANRDYDGLNRRQPMKQHLETLTKKDGFNSALVNKNDRAQSAILFSVATFLFGRSLHQICPGSLHWTGDPFVISAVPMKPSLVSALNVLVPVLSRCEFDPAKPIPYGSRFHYVTLVSKMQQPAGLGQSLWDTIYSSFVPQSIAVNLTIGKRVQNPTTNVHDPWYRFSASVPFPKISQSGQTSFAENVVLSACVGLKVTPQLSVAVQGDTSFDRAGAITVDGGLRAHLSNGALSLSASAHNSKGLIGRFEFPLLGLKAFVAGGLAPPHASTFNASWIPRYGTGLTLDL